MTSCRSSSWRSVCRATTRRSACSCAERPAAALCVSGGCCSRPRPHRRTTCRCRKASSAPSAARPSRNNNFSWPRVWQSRRSWWPLRRWSSIAARRPAESRRSSSKAWLCPPTWTWRSSSSRWSSALPETPPTCCHRTLRPTGPRDSQSREPHRIDASTAATQHWLTSDWLNKNTQRDMWLIKDRRRSHTTRISIYCLFHMFSVLLQ